MKLKVVVEKPVELRKCLSFLVGLRRMCVFRFTEQQLIIVSSGLNEPTIWCKLDSSIFQLYEVDSTRNNVIPFEINIEPLLQVLRNYEKSNVSSSLVIRLQRRPSNGGEIKNKAAASLALFYTEQISMTSNVSHSFNVPVRLLKMDSDLRIVEPAMDSMKLAMKLPMRIVPLLKRLERYRTPVERAAGRSARRRGFGAAELGLECAATSVAESEAETLERWCEADGAV
ncbi:hypothetical protein KL941_004380 [Ogataea angusta]|nr:hypothetical protein KL941_004380 [Ogataea angusta]